MKLLNLPIHTKPQLLPTRHLIKSLVAVGLLIGYAAANPAYAQSAQGSNPNFAIRGFNIKGENPLSADKTSQVLAPFLRNDANIETLQKATVALETALKDAGYGLHKVSLPPQEVGDTVSLEIVKFTIGRVLVEGNQNYDEENIRRSVPEMQEGTSPNFKRLAIQTAAANDNPNKQITVALKESRESDKIDAVIEVRDSKVWAAGLIADNSGNHASGSDRTTLLMSHSNLFNRDHQIVVARTTSIEEPGKVRNWGLTYRVPFYSAGSTLGVSLMKSDVVGNFGSFSTTGAGLVKALNYTLALAPSGGYRSFVTASLEDKLFGATQISSNGISTSLGSSRRSRPLVLSYAARIEALTSSTAYNLDFSINTGTGSHNNLSAYRGEYSPVGMDGITTRAFKVLRMGYSHQRKVFNDWALSSRSQAQLTANALIAGEQLGLGGVNSVRGVSDRAIVGDSGLQTTLELTSSELFKGLRWLGFVDAGWLSGHNADQMQRMSSDRLASIGLGLRYSHTSGVSFSADYGRLLLGSQQPLTSNSSAPQKGDDKLHVNLSIRF